MPPEEFVRPLLVRTHKTRIARHIGGKNGDQPAFEAFYHQSGVPNRIGPGSTPALGILTLGARAGIPFN
jgi:hypothetical protein